MTSPFQNHDETLVHGHDNKDIGNDNPNRKRKNDNKEKEKKMTYYFNFYFCNLIIIGLLAFTFLTRPAFSKGHRSTRCIRMELDRGHCKL